MELSNILGSISNIEDYQKLYNHDWRKHETKVRKKNIDKRRNYLSEKINQNDLMSKKHKKVYTVLNYIDHQHILIFTVSGYVSISAFALAGIHIGITRSEIEINIRVITAGIKKYKSIIKKEKKHNKIVLLAKTKLNSVEVLTSKALIDDFAWTNNVLKEFYHMKEEN